MNNTPYRKQIADYIRLNANPPDKFSHQVRLYRLASDVAKVQPHDDDVIYAAAWMHDLGVFIGHRPLDPAALATWDWVAYAMAKTPLLLQRFGFPNAKITAVIEAIRTHLPSSVPTTFEGQVLHDADILEQLGAVAILRTVSKIGRDTRFILFSDALRVLKNNTEELPSKLLLETARQMAAPKLQSLKAFLASAEAEASGADW